MYTGIRVLDCCDERGIIAGQMLADMGADVIAVEPPSGNAARRLPPFAGDHPGIERSLYWLSYARNKRSITLDTASDDGRALLGGLLGVSDVLLLSGRDSLAALGGFDALAACSPRLIAACVTPFGLEGPKAGYAATDLTVMAASGVSKMTGDLDRAPLRGILPQSWLHAGADAAVGVLLALAERDRSGRGQLVTVSAQVSAMNATQSTIVASGVGDSSTTRASGGVHFGGIDLKFTYPCKDGYVSITFLFGTVAGLFTRRLMEWVHEDGFVDDATLNKDWVSYGLLLVTGKEPIAEYNRVKQAVTDFTLSHTKAELFEGALKRQVLLAPCATPADLVESPQLASRDYFWHMPSPIDGHDVAVPGAFAKLPCSPLASLRPAPSLGEHNADVYGDLLGITPDELASLRGAGVI